MRARSCCRTASGSSSSPIRRPGTRRASSAAGERRCTSRQASARHSCPSASSPARKRPSSSYDVADMTGHSVIAPEVLARYARDAASEVTTVRGARAQGAGVEVHVVVDYGRNLAEVAADVQRRVAEYLEQMTDVRPATVHVVV